MPVTVLTLTAALSLLALIVGWVLGALVGDSRGVVGYVLATLIALAGVFYLAGW